LLAHLCLRLVVVVVVVQLLVVLVVHLWVVLVLQQLVLMLQRTRLEVVVVGKMVTVATVAQVSVM
jgi:hypothetical protein